MWLRRFRNNYVEKDILCINSIMERNILSLTTHKIMNYVIIYFYIIDKHILIILCFIKTGYTKDYVLNIII